jgi:hypothetical protein
MTEYVITLLDLVWAQKARISTGLTPPVVMFSCAKDGPARIISLFVQRERSFEKILKKLIMARPHPCVRSFEKCLASDWFIIFFTVEIRAFCAQTKSSKVMTYSVIDWHDVPFGWIVFAFFLWTGLAHLVYVTILWTRYKDSLEEGRRWTLRWVEYAVSASLMYFLILYFFGIINSIVLIVMSVAVFCVILSPAVVKSKTAMILVAVIYATVWLYPFIRLFAENWDTLGQITWFVWLILLGEFVLFNLFPA